MSASNGFGDTRTVTVNGATLAYREQGQGEPVVFVHGDLRDMRSWEEQVEGLGSDFRAITYSRRYARPNEDLPPGVDNPMSTHVEDLSELLRELDAAPAHLVGNSWGAFVCLMTAIRHPELVRSMVLEEPPVLTLFVSPDPRPTEVAALLVRRPRTGLSLIKFAATVIAPAEKAFERGEDEKATRTFLDGVIGRGGFEEMSDAQERQTWGNVSTLKAGMLGEAFPPLEDEEVRAVGTETLLLTGERSHPFFARLTDRLEELLPRAERVEIPGAGHDMHEDAPAAVNRQVREFVAAR